MAARLRRLDDMLDEAEQEQGSLEDEWQPLLDRHPKARDLISQFDERCQALGVDPVISLAPDDESKIPTDDTLKELACSILQCLAGYRCDCSIVE